MSSPQLILIVNDSEPLNRALGLLLESHGYRVEIAEDGHDALDRFDAGLRPCMVLLDLIMPVMNGFSFRHEQSRRRSVQDIPVVVMSAFTMLDDPAIRDQLKAAAYVSLPNDIDRIPSIVHEHCALPQLATHEHGALPRRVDS